MPIIVTQPTGLSVGKVARIGSITLDFLDSLGVKYGQDETNLSDVIFWEGASQGLFTGPLPMPFLRGYSRDAVVYLESAKPYPFTIRMVSPEIEITQR